MISGTVLSNMLSEVSVGVRVQDGATTYRPGGLGPGSTVGDSWGLAAA